MGLAGRLRPRRLAEEAKESRPMESEHPVVEINITLLLLRKFGDSIDKVVFQQHEESELKTHFLFLT
ncbi:MULTISPECIES: hypothetical protein [Bacillaceae]|uniref:Uncharacterized protein n=1 Tax=Gottfriedia luciferensis TaxID=178774 RepID=A0ABX2ZRR9_9BACI|nr:MULTISPECIES: hypothetical protein [Bacillaceae]ODG92466.1 hypothetical protein BED47_19875 [Gottfriedia luciferensis]SFD49787.1 hypothetical protein SAMN02799633_03971 [Bacillus sp. UNCCL81]